MMSKTANSISLLTMTLCLVIAFAATPALAAKCGNNAKGFGKWLVQFKKEARKKGIRKKTLRRALHKTRYNRSVIKKDRAQKKYFTKTTFASFYKKRVSSGGIKRGRQMKRRHGKLLRRIERKFGVQKEILVAIWSLESFFGEYTGNLSVFQTLPTLAYDCRRTKLFTDNLISALQIVQRGDMRASKMKGGIYGEIGQTQFMAKSYRKYAVDFDGNGRADLINSKPDVLASTANLLRRNGWKRGGCYKSGCHNFRVLNAWNESTNYQRTISRLAGRLR